MKRTIFFNISPKKVVVVAVLLTFLFYGCNNEPQKQYLGTTNNKTYQLEMTEMQYNDLKNAFPGNSLKMVLQFYYNQVNPSSLSLVAFATRPGNVFEVTPGNTVSRILAITADNPVTIPDDIILGDQQVNFRDIDRDIINGATGYTLVFRPIVIGNRIKFKICLKGRPCPAAEVFTQPSPPANASN